MTFAHLQPGLVLGSHPFLRRMSALAALTQADRALIAALPPARERYMAGEDLFEEGAAVGQARIIVSGWGCRMRLLPDGRRQIFMILLPGDAIGLCARPEPLALSTTVALTRLETVDASSIAEAIGSDSAAHAGLSAAVKVSSGVEEAGLLDHITRLGRQTAFERTAHLLLELRHRLNIAGLADGRRFPLPLTQEVLSDVLGLSIVHVNRTIQQLRRENLIVLRSGSVELINPERLAEIAAFTPPLASARPRRAANADSSTA
ncbi:MAG TPA: Crp/Fnr family transcriptional regulator [Caulobacteraceae bacterium]|jgi:CRP-like cAMP-binding protein